MKSMALMALAMLVLSLIVFSGCTAPSEPVGKASAVAIDFTPGIPTGLNAKSSGGLVALSWAPPTETVESYEIFRNCNGRADSGFTAVGTLDLGLVQNVPEETKSKIYSFIDPKVKKGIDCCYKIMAQLSLSGRTYQSGLSETACVTVS